MKEGDFVPDKRSRIPKPKEGIDLGRRAFMFQGAAAAAYLAGPPAWEAGWNTVGSEKLKQSITELESFLTKRYGIPMHTRSKILEHSFGPYSYKDLQHQSLYLEFKGLEAVRDSLALYPPALIRKYIRGVQLAYDIHSASSKSDVIVNAPGGVAIPWEGKILIRSSADSLFGTHQAVFGHVLAPAVVQHEIAHCVLRDIKEKDWASLQPGFQYRGKEWANGGKPTGFAAEYGTLDYKEDIATVAELLFKQPRSDMQKRARSLVGLSNDEEETGDAILEKKKDFLRKSYERVSGGTMNALYWDALKRGNISESYWNSRM